MREFIFSIQLKSTFYPVIPISYPQLVSKVLNTFSPAVVGEWRAGHHRACGPPSVLHDSIVTGEGKAAWGGPEQELAKQKRRCRLNDSGAVRWQTPFSPNVIEKNITFEESREELRLGLHLEFKCHTGCERFLQETIPSYLGLVDTRLLSKWRWHKALTLWDRWTDNERNFQKNVGRESYLAFIYDKTKIIVGVIIFS